MEQNFPVRNLRKFGYNYRGCPVFQKLWKILFFWPPEISEFWVEQKALEEYKNSKISNWEVLIHLISWNFHQNVQHFGNLTIFEFSGTLVMVLSQHLPSFRIFRNLQLNGRRPWLLDCQAPSVAHRSSTIAVIPTRGEDRCVVTTKCSKVYYQAQYRIYLIINFKRNLTCFSLFLCEAQSG